MEESQSREDRIKLLAKKILHTARVQILLHLRFLDHALAFVKAAESEKWGFACDGENLYYDPELLLIRYREDQTFPVRLWLHVLVHSLFAHPFAENRQDTENWNLACDIFAEGILAQLQLNLLSSPQQNYRAQEADKFRKQIRPFTAEKICRWLTQQPASPEQRKDWEELFALDDHRIWGMEPSEGKGILLRKNRKEIRRFTETEETEDISDADQTGNQENTKAVWSRIAAQVETELLSGSRQQGERTADLERALGEMERHPMDYAKFLQKFAARSEVMKVSLDEFDYIFYTYGLALYGDTPLIEPLEYREDRKIRDFVIVIDTSGSVSGKTVRMFLQKTWEVLKSRETFDHKFSLHIIQCDASVKQDDKITDQREFDLYIQNVRIHGFGGTDFRPAFTFVEELQRKNEFRDLKGMLYFTDGLGVFPERPPAYLTAFVFVDEESRTYAKVPPWAITVVMDREDLKVYPAV